jgi:hypothetical protein
MEFHFISIRIKDVSVSHYINKSAASSSLDLESLQLMASHKAELNFKLEHLMGEFKAFN